MPAVKVKVLGLFAMTRRTYLTFQVIELLVLLALTGLSLWWPRPQLPAEGQVLPAQKLLLGLLNLLPWLGLFLVVVWWPLETLLYLRKFARQQAEADKAAGLASPEAPLQERTK